MSLLQITTHEHASRVTKTPTCFLDVDAGRLDTFAERSFDPLQLPRITLCGSVLQAALSTGKISCSFSGDQFSLNQCSC